MSPAEPRLWSREASSLVSPCWWHPQALGHSHMSAKSCDINGRFGQTGPYVFFSYLAFSRGMGSSFFKVIVECKLGKLRSASSVCSWKVRGGILPRGAAKPPRSTVMEGMRRSSLGTDMHFCTCSLERRSPVFSVHLVWVEWISLKRGLVISTSKCPREDLWGAGHKLRQMKCSGSFFLSLPSHLFSASINYFYKVWFRNLRVKKEKLI